MTFFPPAFDPRADVVGALNLININTPDGDFGFMQGVDGIFTDITTKQWWGSRLITTVGGDQAIGGVAPSGALTLSYFDDPDSDQLVAQIKALGVAYVVGRPITFYVQPLTAMEQFHAPVLAPVLYRTRYMSAISIIAQGPLKRILTLSFESANANRNAATGLKYTTADHAALIGSANPSLALMPSDTYQEEPLFA